MAFPEPQHHKSLKPSIPDALRRLFNLKQRVLKSAKLVTFSFLFFLFCLIGFAAPNLETTFHDVEQGKCASVRLGNDYFLIVDAGSGKKMDPSKKLSLITDLGQALQTASFRSSPKILVSHKDQDHVNLLPGILRILNSSGRAGPGMAPTEIFLGGNEHNYDAKTRESLRELKGAGHKVTFASEIDDPLHLPNFSSTGDLPPIKVDILHHQPLAGNANASSLVNKVTFHGKSVLFTGDATEASVQDILPREGAGKADVFEVDHHGADTAGSNSAEWISHVAPQAAVVSAGKKNTHGHPRASVIERLCGKVGDLPYQGVDSSAAPHELTFLARNADEARKVGELLSDQDVRLGEDHQHGKWGTAKTNKNIFNTADQGDIVCTIPDEAPHTPSIGAKIPPLPELEPGEEFP